MPIVTNQVQQSPQNDGSSHVVLRLYDQDGREYMQSFWLASGVDLNTIVTNKIAAMDVQLAESEFEALIGS